MRLGGRTSCTHGDDAPPNGTDVNKERSTTALKLAATTASSAATSTGGRISCFGNGTSGNRVQALYVVSSDRVDRYASLVGAINAYAVNADGFFSMSAARMGSDRHIRWVTNPDCSLAIERVVISPSGDDSTYNTQYELYTRGYNRADRKYAIWQDSIGYCGIAPWLDDDQPGQANANNGTTAQAVFAMTSSACWGGSPEAHELTHVLGAVQRSAPHSDGKGHCRQEYDLMCTNDGTDATTFPCPYTEDDLLDCGGDDYFNTNPPAGSYIATHWNVANSSFLLGTVPPVDACTTNSTTFTPAPAPASVPATGAFQAVIPTRVLDTRIGLGAPVACVAPGGEVSVQVTGRAGVPTSNVDAVAVNVTAISNSAGGYATVFASGTPQPATSNLNYDAGKVVANFALVKVGANGRITISNMGGYTYYLVDVVGYTPIGSSMNTITPTRVLDTRIGNGAAVGSLSSGQIINVQITGKGVPLTGVDSVFVNLTAVTPTSAGFATLFPTGSGVPTASNVNFAPGTTVANFAAVKLGSGGQISIYHAGGNAHYLIDVVGFAFANSTVKPLSPVRLLDTRIGNGAPAARLSSGQTLDVQISGRGGVPAAGIDVVMVNVTAVSPSTAGFATVFPTGTAVPNTSNLNFAPGQVVAGFALVKVGVNGKLSIRHEGGTADYLIDVSGYFASS